MWRQVTCLWLLQRQVRGSQTTWLPCEVEALSIAAAAKHFSPYLIQSVKKACILTDSKPCIQAYEKLCRGEFSASLRVSTFLSVVSHFQASVRYISGAAIFPSDFANRNAAACENEICQVCSFISRTRDSVVRAVSVQDVLQCKVCLPFTSQPAWVAVQSECPDLRRTHAHLVQGTRPSKKLTNIKDVKIIDKLHQLQMMASLLRGVMNPCHHPESASLSHAKLWTAF